MTYKSFLFSGRVFRWSSLAHFALGGDLSHSLSLEPTAGRPMRKFNFMKQVSEFAVLAAASGGSSCSR
jgi:hypothetical protein